MAIAKSFITAHKRKIPVASIQPSGKTVEIRLSAPEQAASA
jgi:K+-sensing histidine kinase KdpD